MEKGGFFYWAQSIYLKSEVTWKGVVEKSTKKSTKKYGKSQLLEDCWAKSVQDTERSAAGVTPSRATTYRRSSTPKQKTL